MILSVNLVLITPHYFRSNLESVNGDITKWNMICVCQNNVFSVTKFVKVSADTGNTPLFHSDSNTSMDLKISGYE